MRKHLIVIRHISKFLLVLIFCLVLVAYFFAYQKVFKQQDFTDKGKQVELTQTSNFAKEQLSLQQDINRFLDVYFKQDFESQEDRLAFVQIEYVRFLDYQLVEVENQDLLVDFVRVLGSMVDKIQNNNLDLTSEETKLKGLYKNL